MIVRPLRIAPGTTPTVAAPTACDFIDRLCGSPCAGAFARRAAPPVARQRHVPHGTGVARPDDRNPQALAESTAPPMGPRVVSARRTRPVGFRSRLRAPRLPAACDSRSQCRRFRNAAGPCARALGAGDGAIPDRARRPLDRHSSPPWHGGTSRPLPHCAPTPMKWCAAEGATASVAADGNGNAGIPAAQKYRFPGRSRGRAAVLGPDTCGDITLCTAL